MTSTSAAIGSPHNHFNCTRGCDPAKPLTLIDREVITGRQIAGQDDAGNWYCADCLADLPAYANGNLDFRALWHVCGEDLPAEPEQAGEVPEPQPEAPLKVVTAKVGDIVQYLGDLPGFHGTVWEVTVWDRRRGLLRVVDVDRALYNVPQADVTVLQTASVRRRLRKRADRKTVSR